jgi:hypothetical protein
MAARKPTMPETLAHRWERKKGSLRTALDHAILIGFDVIFGERPQAPPPAPGPAGETVIMTIGPPRQQKGKK